MNRRMGLVLVSLLAWGASSAHAATLEKVAIEGDLAPDPGFFYHRKFLRPAVSDAAGQHVVASVRLIPATARQCLVAFDPGPGPDGLVACRKDTSPDGHLFSKLGDPTINIAGNTAWAATVGFGLSGVYRGSPPTVVAFTGDPSPAGSGLLKTFSSAAITDAGDVVFEAGISGGAVVLGVTVDHGYFRCMGGDGNCSTGGTGTAQTLVLRNDPIPDRPGRKLCKLLTFSASLYGIAFQASTQMDCASTTEGPLSGIFRKPFVGTVTTVALQGEASEPNPVPGGTIYGNVNGPPAINDTGTVAFRGQTIGLVGNDIIYLCDPVSCPASPATVAVRQGDQDDIGNFFRRLSSPGVSSAGDVAFQALFTGAQRGSAVYIRRAAGGTIEPVARENDIAPGVSPAAQFTFFGPASMSPAGKVAFKAKVRFFTAAGRREGYFLLE